MSVSKIASRYAKPLLELAIDQGKLDRVVSDVEGLQSAMENRDFKLLLDSPIINPSKKLQIVEQLFKDKMDVTTYSFVELIVKKGREGMLGDISNEFIKRYHDFKKVSEVELITAAELSNEELDSFRKKLEASSETMESVDIKTSVDPSIIGGFIIKIGDKSYNASVKHKLEKLRKSLSIN